MLEPTLTAQQSILGEHLEALTTMNNLALLFMSRGDSARAEPLYRRSGVDHAYTLMTTKGLARLLENQKRLGEAEPLLREAWAILERTKGRAHAETVAMLHRLLRLLRSEEKFSEVVSIIEGAWPTLVEELGAEHPELLRLRNRLAIANQSSGNHDGAERIYSQVVAGSKLASLPDERIGLYLDNHGRCLMKLKRYQEAEGQLLDAYRRLNGSVGPEERRTRRVIEHLIALYDAWDRPGPAAEYRARLSSSEKNTATPPADGQGS